MDELIAQLAQVENLDPEARQRLAADFRQTDPALWPGIVQAFHAVLAYRQQVEQRERPRPAASVSSSSNPLRTETTATEADRSKFRDESAMRLAARPTGAAEEKEGKKTEGKKAGEVPPATFSPGEAGQSWREHLAAAITALEASLQNTSGGGDRTDAESRLRMLYALSNRRDDALRPIPSVPPMVQDFWRQELYGLSVWLDLERIPDQGRRAGEARQHLSGAVEALGAMAPLAVRNLAFVSEVTSYGITKPFDKYEFTPGQPVLLYAEVDNFTSEAGTKGHHTVLKGSCRIFDSRGQQVDERELGTTEEDCRNPRRDFFVGYPLRLPKRIYGGKHTLQLTVEDVKSKKVGQSSIEFTVKDAKD